MAPGRGIPPSGQRGKRYMDDLRFPAEGDPFAFALAFVALARERDVPTRHPVRRQRLKGTDNIGLPSAGNPGNFACAFSFVHDPRYPAMR
jgi:hypothetical protein